MTENKPPRSRWRRWLRRCAFAMLGFGLMLAAGGLVGSWYIDYRGIAHPPALPARPPILDQMLEEQDGMRRIGANWLGQRDHLMYMSLTGDAFTLGYANAVLTTPYLLQQGQALQDAVHEKLGAPWKFWLLKKYVTWRNRDLPDFVPAPYQMEVLGLATGGPPAPAGFGPAYHVILNCHAAHDISHMVMGHPLVGCAAFAAWDEATANGHLIVGRNFDWNAGACFDQNKIVVHVAPDEGLRFISVSWPGMAGVVSGINEARVAVTVNAGQSSDQPSIGIPISILIRDVLQHASTLEEAVDMVRTSQVFVADAYLVADGTSGRAVVVEKSPHTCVVRQPDGSSIACTNHFLRPPLRDDPANQAYSQEATSVTRYQRLTDLVAQAHGTLDVPAAARILRDAHLRALGKPVLGHPATLANLETTHSVIMDVTDGIVWVSTYPHQLGQYVPFQIDSFAKRPDVPGVPPASALVDGAYDRCLRAGRLIAEARAHAESGDIDQALACLDTAIESQPDHYRAWLLRGQLLQDNDQPEKARASLTRARALQPGFASERADLERRLGRIR